MEHIQPEVITVEYLSSCVGVQHRPKSLHRMLCEDGDFMHHLTLVPEPTNKFDPNAIAVLYKGNVAGYIPKDDTDETRNFLAYLRGFSSTKWNWEITGAKFMADNVTPQWFSFTITVECTV